MLATIGLTLGLGSVANALASAVPEGDARNFAILAGSTITNANSSTVTGDIGLHPGSSITGYGPGADQIAHTGEVHATNTVAGNAKTSVSGAYVNAAAQGTEFTIPSDLAGATLVPGVYRSDTEAFGLSGTLTLDPGGDSAAIYIFQMNSGLTTSTGSTVVLNGVSPCNVYWQVGSSATLASGSSFAGTVMADQSISMGSGASLQGRLWARTGAVTLNNNTITNTCFSAGATGPGTGVPTAPASGPQVPNAPTGGVATGDGSTLGAGTHASTTLAASNTTMVGAAMLLAAIGASAYGWRRRNVSPVTGGRDSIH